MGITLEAGEFGIFPARLAKNLKPTQQVILAWLWFHKNNETNSCFPSLATLQKECGVSSKNTVLNALKELESLGLIAKDKRFDDKGNSKSNVYHIMAKREGGGSINELGGGSKNELGVVQNMNPNYKKVNHKNISNIDFASIDAEFEQAWIAYDRKGNKQTSLRYWRKLTDKDREQIISVIPNYIKARPDKKFRKDFQGWINPSNKMWQDELVIDEEVNTEKGRMTAAQLKEWNKQYGN
jgi:hypothetical protein